MFLRIIMALFVGNFLLQASPLPSSDKAFVDAVDKLPDSSPLCKTLKVETEALLDFSLNSLPTVKNSQEMQKAMEILSSIPSTDGETIKLYRTYLSQDKTNQKELGRFYKLMAHNCWKTQELKLWKALLNYYERASENEQRKIKNFYKTNYLQVSSQPISMIQTMVRIVIIKRGVDEDLIPVSFEARQRLKKIRKDVRHEAQLISKAFQEITDSFGSDWEETPLSQEALSLYFEEIKKEAAAIEQTNQSLDQWILSFALSESSDTAAVPDNVGD